MQNRIVLNDNTEIINGVVSRSSNNELMVRIPGGDLSYAILQFGNPDKTEKIICYNSIYKYTYYGYTQVYSVQYFQEDDQTEIWLRPPVNGETSFQKEIIVPHEYVPEEITMEVDR